MKTRIVIGGLVLVATGSMAFQAFGQSGENDDMYFNSKDRKKLMAEKAFAPSDKSVNDKIDGDYNAFRKAHFDKNEAQVDSVNNPTDSFSARNVNPEYISRSNSEQASEDEQNYYVEGYGANNATNSDSYSANNYSNGNYNNYSNYNNNNGYYGSNYGYGYSPYNSSYSPYNSLYSPYYGSCNPWMSPYYGSGLTLSLGYMFGSPGWNYGMSYGYGNSYYNPYSYGYYSGYSPYSNYGYGYPTYYTGGSDASQTNYGKRPSRHSAVVTPTPRYVQHVSSNTSGNSGGRTRQPVDEYYVKPFRRTTTYDNSSVTYPSSTDGSRYSRPTSSDYPASRTRESYTSPTRESRSSYSTPSYSSPSRSSYGGSSPVRSSGGSVPSRSRGH